ncbi:MAG: hypothetical protein M0C28_29695 [Candidatus Moduliflexus flocculans]|nr:hypothetical protein [Candidatus Moduliflexus flocculans]
MLEKDGDAAWGEIVAKYDGYSTREFLEALRLVGGHDRDVSACWPTRKP